MYPAGVFVLTGGPRVNERPVRFSTMVLAGCLAGGLALPYAALAEDGASAQVAASATVSKAALASAKKHYGDGEKKLKAEDFAGALIEFKSANDIKATPQAEYNMGTCEDRLGHVQAAAEWYAKFLAHVPDKMTEKGDQVRKRVADIKALPGKVRIESNPPGASVTIDDQPASSPTPTDVQLAPGTHSIKLTETGRLPAARSLDVAFASTQSVTVDLEEAPPPPPPASAPPPAAAAPPAAPPPPPPPPSHSKLPAFITGGLAVAAAGVGAVFGAMALHDKSNFDKNPTTSTADDGDSHSLISDMAFGVAITFGVTSAVLFLTKDEPSATASNAGRPAADAQVASSKSTAITVTPVPVVGPHSGGAGVLVRF
jgi:tetratricopeptide (TPR) repeat protein